MHLFAILILTMMTSNLISRQIDDMMTSNGFKRLAIETISGFRFVSQCVIASPQDRQSREQK